jgi:hypothetical protein
MFLLYNENNNAVAFKGTRGDQMIELHGWLSISATYRCEDLLPRSEIDRIMQDVNEIVSNCQYEIDLRYVNGCAFINTLYCSNHRTEEVDVLIETYKRISEIATGSYGILFIRDDEDKQFYNDMQVYIFKRGKCLMKKDTDFSPCIPTIEDEFILK